MARPRKEGVEYFPLDCDFFSNRKVKRICRHTGSCLSKLILVALLTLIYKGKGYYILNDDDTVFDVADITGAEETLVRSTIDCAIDSMFFSKSIAHEYNVLTSESIQERYFLMKKQKNKKTLNFTLFPYLCESIIQDVTNEPINHQAISDNELFGEKHRQITNNNELVGENECISTQSKVKESKVNKNKSKVNKIESKGKESNNESLQDLSQFYQNNKFGLITPYIYSELEDALAEYGLDWCMKALEISVSRDVRSWKYAIRILQDWKIKYAGDEKPWEVESSGVNKKQDRRISKNDGSNVDWAKESEGLLD